MAAACEDDQSFPKQSPMAVYDDKNLAVTLNSYATYTADVPVHCRGQRLRLPGQ